MLPVDILQNMRVPGLTIAFIILNIVIAVLLPIALFVWLKVKYKARFIPALLGAGMLFAFGILQLLFLRLFQLGMLISVWPTPVFNIILYIVIMCLCAGLFTETGRFIAFTWILKRDIGEIKTPLAYGAGYGIMGIAIVMSALGRLSYATLINNGQIVNRSLSDDFIVELIDFAQTNSFDLLLIGVRFILIFTLYICLSVLVWLAVMRKQYLLYPAAILLHALTFVPAILFDLRVLENAWFVMGLTALCVLITAALIWYIYAKIPNRAPVLLEPEFEREPPSP